MKLLLIILISFSASCAVKQIGKNCMKAETSEYYVCDAVIWAK